MTTKELDEAVRLAREVANTWECTMCNGKRHPYGFAHSEAVRAGLTISVGDSKIARALLAVHEENERMRLEHDPRLARCATCDADEGQSCTYVPGTPRVWWPNYVELPPRISVHRARIDAATKEKP